MRLTQFIEGSQLRESSICHVSLNSIRYPAEMLIYNKWHYAGN